LEGGVTSGKLKHQFSQMEMDLDFFLKIYPILIAKKRTPIKKLIVTSCAYIHSLCEVRV
jgi:hypothetical protein